MLHSFKVCVNRQQIFSEKFQMFIEIDYLLQYHCDYQLLSSNITNQLTIIEKYHASSTYQLAL